MFSGEHKILVFNDFTSAVLISNMTLLILFAIKLLVGFNILKYFLLQNDLVVFAILFEVDNSTISTMAVEELGDWKTKMKEKRFRLTVKY